jgi:PEGA domain-containing protein
MTAGPTSGKARRVVASIAMAVAVTLALAGLVADPPAFADGRHGGGHGGRGGGFHGGFHGGRSALVVASPFFSPFGWDWFYGFGWPYSPYGYRPEGGLDPVVARAQGLGGFDLNVKPRTAEVWVDGKYVGLVRDFDGYPSFLWLEQGDHTIAISKGGYATWEQEVTIDAGRVSEMKIDLVAGPSQPPSDD